MLYSYYIQDAQALVSFKKYMPPPLPWSFPVLYLGSYYTFTFLRYRRKWCLDHLMSTKSRGGGIYFLNETSACAKMGVGHCQYFVCQCSMM